MAIWDKPKWAWEYYTFVREDGYRGVAPIRWWRGGIKWTDRYGWMRNGELWNQSRANAGMCGSCRVARPRKPASRT